MSTLAAKYQLYRRGQKPYVILMEVNGTRRFPKQLWDISVGPFIKNFLHSLNGGLHNQMMHKSQN